MSANSHKQTYEQHRNAQDTSALSGLKIKTFSSEE